MKIKHKKRVAPVQILAAGFAFVIFIGTLLLRLPIAAISGEFTPWVDCVFTATSAVCVTGLTTLNTAEHWTYFGKTVIILLIQIGGLGFMSFTTLFALLLGKKITLKDRLIMQEAMNFFSLQGLVKLAKYILIFTLSVEGAGALFLSTRFVPEYGFGKGIYFSIFHSISAFCNAGFDLTGNSLVPYAQSTVVIITISALIIIGGLGFAVWAEIYGLKDIRRLSLHSKVVISMSLALVFGGWLFMLLFEMKNPATIGSMNMEGKIINSFFAAVTPRTAGFNAISLPDMTMAGTFLTMILMFIGGSPGSTAGGIKTSTIGLILMALVSIIRNREETVIFQRRISRDLINKAIAVMFVGLGVVMLTTFILCITEPKATFEYISFEAFSAFGTVGLTLGLTPELSFIGKIVVALTMYMGRVGPLTLILAISSKKKGGSIRYPEGKILVG
ncbi:TrkH family potassium uptake protein [Clostridium grantii]|uniref:Trk system potassium uptake protein TrkH n=1 Tax=Clostridium grantii DSM 8605 TaxID=1121316 RepID=A0A1M5XKA2_9CLOT|nr:TrkH family potassium uptake protein [Clostridium grantii]SHI00179.1 trk system potassium uptake protein TrkH [Clostridium grantii DSM 8605]